MYRAFDKETGYAIADIMMREDEKITTDDLIIVSPIDYLKKTKINNFELVELQQPIFESGELVYDDPEILVKRDYCEKAMAHIYPEVKTCHESPSISCISNRRLC